MVRPFLGDSGQAMLPLQQLFIALAANDTPNDWRTDTVTVTQVDKQLGRQECLQNRLPLLLLLLLLVYFSHNSKHRRW